MISVDEVTLLLRGWGERKSTIRVLVQSPEFVFSAFCTLYKAEGGRVAFWIGTEPGRDGFDLLLNGALFEFGDVPPDAVDANLRVGGKVESGIMGARGSLKIAFMLLGDAGKG